MRIGLFVPCYIDAFFPEVGIAIASRSFAQNRTNCANTRKSISHIVDYSVD